MGNESKPQRRPTCLQLCYFSITAAVISVALVGAFYLQSEEKPYKSLQRIHSWTISRLSRPSEIQQDPDTRRLLLQTVPQIVQRSSSEDASLSPAVYTQPYVNGEPEYECTHSWFSPCTAADKKLGPPLHMVQPGKLSQEDQDMLAVIRNFKQEREALAARVSQRKVAFMFLAKGPLPFAPLWQRFFKGHEGKYTVYVHTRPGYRFPGHMPPAFNNSQIRSEQVLWGSPTMVDAERRLLGAAVADPGNHRFVLVSESCVPVQGFLSVWNYLMSTNHSFVANYWTKQRVCAGRYDKHMAPEIMPNQWRKGLQWMTLTREHALMALEDDAVYKKMEKYCRGDKWHHTCYMDEHYFPTLLHIKDPTRLANRTVTFTDFGGWSIHPRKFEAVNVTDGLIRYITQPHDLNPRNRYTLPCSRNGFKRSCFLFARKFGASALPKLMKMPKSLGF